jgi:hypothetical protein
MWDPEGAQVIYKWKEVVERAENGGTNDELSSCVPE